MKLLILGFVVLATLLITRNMSTGPVIGEFDILARIESKAQSWGLQPAIAKAIAKVESNLNPWAKNPADPSYGLMQITPMLAQDYGLVKDYKNPTQAEINKLYDINKNLDVGCPHLKKLLSKYSFNEAVQMYNLGERGYLLGRRNSTYLERVKVAYGKYS